MRRTALVTLALTILALPGCVEIDGQRLSWSYDSAKDELRILIHYDGVHDTEQGEPGAEQIPKFVEDGSVMLLDWILHLDMGEFRAMAEKEDAPPAQRQFAQLMLTLEVRPVGFYREPNGKLGAAQMVVVPNAKEFVGTINGMLNDSLIAQEIKPEEQMARTGKRMQAAAKEGHQWISLDGHSVRVVLPVDRGEWDHERGRFLEEAAKAVAKALAKDANEDAKNGYQLAHSLLASMPVSYVDDGDRVEFVIGRQATPTTVRAEIRDEYKPNLEQVLIETVKTDLDRQLAAALLDETVQPAEDIAALLEFGPPEDQVRALIAAAQSDDEGQRKAAIERLGQWADSWNENQAVPKVPQPADDTAEYLAAWKKWYATMKR